MEVSVGSLILEKVFSYESLVHAISGATGGISAISLFYPLNNVRIRLQVEEHRKDDGMFKTLINIYQEDGLGALYQGWQSSVMSLGCSNFVYFYIYNALKTVIQVGLARRAGAKKLKPLQPVENLAVASFAGICNVLITTPLWVAGTRLTVQNKKEIAGAKNDSAKPYKGMFDCLSRMYNEEGVAGLWKGVGPSIILVTNPSIQFVTYENLKNKMLARASARGTGITSFEYFVMGAIAKAVATVLTYPLQIAQSRLRADRGSKQDAKSRNYKGTIDCLQKIAAKDGIGGIYKGMTAKLWQTVLTAAFQFLTYEQVAKLVFYVLMGGRPEQSA